MDNYKKLDNVLKVLNGQIMLLSYDQIASKAKANLNLKDFTELRAILNKLIKDGYVEAVLIHHININTKEKISEDDYRITFEGKCFILEGGYEGHFQRLASESIRLDILAESQRVSDGNMVFLTRVIAVGTSIAAVYYLIEIVKHFCEFLKHF